MNPHPHALSLKTKKEKKRVNWRYAIYYEKRLNGNRVTSEINTEHEEERQEDKGRIAIKICPFFASVSFSSSPQMKSCLILFFLLPQK